MNSILLPSIKDYQKGISPLLPPSCCEYPTCSHYAVEGVKKIVGYQPKEVLKEYLTEKVTIK
ncbi:membrane protein insertion efficiency factor YidD [Aerococcus urinaeequi]|uniref:membrane protein insertion efficiency factor YidD n=1 Tax=Aerococcus urinaeequi TaxID=51665 RepID=UPI003ADF2F14